MDGSKFTELVKKEVRDFFIACSVGNNIGVSTKAQNWVNSLNEEEKILLQEVVAESIDNSLFKLYEIMDGVHPKNNIPIEASCNNEKISGKNVPQLHDIYASKI